jgi:hypothetical protein
VSPAYGVSVRVDTASPFMLRKLKEIQRQRVNKQIGLAGRLALVEFFTKKNAEMKSATLTHEGNPKLGHSRPGLFERFARATSFTATPSSITLSVAHPAIRQRIYGGTIKPVRRKYLTIPARKEAYGKSAREAPVELTFGYAQDERRGVMRPALLVKKGRGRRTTKAIGVWYWLAKSVKQKADKSAMIGRDDLLKAIRSNLTGYIQEADRG